MSRTIPCLKLLLYISASQLFGGPGAPSIIIKMVLNLSNFEAKNNIVQILFLGSKRSYLVKKDHFYISIQNFFDTKSLPWLQKYENKKKYLNRRMHEQNVVYLEARNASEIK